MREIKKTAAEEAGAATIIEMTLIFPLVLLVMTFLLYTGFYIMQSVVLYNDAQRIAMAAAREAAIPGYSHLYQDKGVTSVADFEQTPPTDRASIGTVMKVHRLYRYWGNGFLPNEDKRRLEENMVKLAQDSAFVVGGDVRCTITPSNHFLNQQIQVRVVKEIEVPDLLEAIGVADDLNIDVTATAVVSDPAEFIRNSNMVFDLAEYAFNNLKIGKDGQTMSQKVTIYKQKFTDVAGKLGITW